VAAKWRSGLCYVCEQARRRLWGSHTEQWPLAPRGHAPLRSLAEGKVVANIWGAVAARHRGTEEEFPENFFLLFTKFLGA